MNRKDFSLVRVAAAISDVKVANVEYNVKSIMGLMSDAFSADVDVIVFPELCVTGYTCGDLFHSSTLLSSAKGGIIEIIGHSYNTPGMISIIGAPYVEGSKLFNAAYVIQDGNILGIVKKQNLPGYKEFYEERWFAEGKENSNPIFKTPDLCFGVEICEDVWAPEPPSVGLVKRGAEVIFNLSASNELIGKHTYLISLLKQQSARLICGYVYASAGYGESSQDVVYAGNGIILENNKILAKSDRFKPSAQLVVSDIDLESLRNERLTNTTFSKFFELDQDNIIYSGKIKPAKNEGTVRIYNGLPFVPGEGMGLNLRCQEILDIQSHALAKRLDHTGMKPVIGVSGGSDSTWALIVIMEALKKLGHPTSDCIGITMPGFATSGRTKGNSEKLMKALGIDYKTIDITEICRAELKALGHDETTQDITYENVQARTRTQILMNLSNQEHGLVIGTGDLSELALGWCTYNADHMSMYGVNVSVPKTLIKSLIGWYANNVADETCKEVLLDILDTPVSPELTGSGATGETAQVTEDKIGPYELHDFFLYNTLRHGFAPSKILYLSKHATFSKDYTEETIKKWLKVFISRFFSQQFKRSCLPDGPKIGSISLSPRGDWRMPSDADVREWIKQL